MIKNLNQLNADQHSHLPSTAATLQTTLYRMQLHAECPPYLLSLAVHVWFR